MVVCLRPLEPGEVSVFRTSGLWTLMNVSAVGFSGHWNLLNVSAFCLPCCLGLLPGGCCLGREMNRIPHALAMQAKKHQHSQPEELAMLAILFLYKKKMLGSLEIEAPRRNGYAGEGRNIFKRLRK